MKTLVLLFLLFISSASFSQLEVTRNTSKTLYENAGRQSLSQIITETDTLYQFTFQDREFTQIVQLESIAFDNKVELIQFLDLCLDVMNGGEALSTKKYSIFPASKKWVTISNGVGDAYLKRKTIDSIKAILNLQ